MQKSRVQISLIQIDFLYPLHIPTNIVSDIDGIVSACGMFIFITSSIWTNIAHKMVNKSTIIIWYTELTISWRENECWRTQ